MKPLRCLLGRHEWGKWEEVGYHLESKCERCDAVRAKFPHPTVALVRLGSEILKEIIKLKGGENGDRKD